MDWFKVTDEMPRPDDGFVLVHSALLEEPYFVAYYNTGLGEWLSYHGRVAGVTHWCRITSPVPVDEILF